MYRKKKRRLLIAVPLFIASVVIALVLILAQSLILRAQDSSVPTAIKDVRVFDGKRIIPQATVLFEDGRIAWVKKKAKIPDNAVIVDGKGKTLLPGLIDCHVHVWDAQNLRQSLMFGVTAVIDMFMNVKIMQDIKGMQSSGMANDMASLVSAGTLATAPGGHGTQYGVPIPTISNPEEAEDFVAARIAEGSDFIKIIIDDGSAYALSRPTVSNDTLAALIKAAHKRGKLVVVHAATLQNCIDTLEAGADGLAHLFFNNAHNPDFGRLAAKQRAFVIPTLTEVKMISGTSDAQALAESPQLSPYLTPMDEQGLKQSFPFTTGKEAFEAAEKTLKQLKTAGVSILAGTDAPNPGTCYGASIHHELELLVKAGLSPLEALRSATSIPARTFKLTDRGLIEPGKTADLVLVTGNPDEDIRATRSIVDVWKNGVKVDREGYRASIEKEKKAVEQLKNAPAPEHSESGLISDFDGDKITVNFGAGWSISTDELMGGKSTASYRLVKGGAQGSKGSLLITGNIVPESSVVWAGAMFSPGSGIMSPANLSFKKAISFWAKGDGKKYSVMIFAQSLGFMPAIQTFLSGPKWKEYIFPYSQFGLEGHDIMAIFIGSSQEPGEFSLQIDEVRLK